MPGTSTLINEVESDLMKLNLESLESEQLFRLGIACSLAGYPQEAGGQRWDLIFDNVSWKCVRILSSRPGHRVGHYLKEMKAVIGRDAGASLQFREYIEK
ncbi:MAG: hypothetical protein KAR45_09230 [Desulfobacteraceae bacterium]|nr:hypothetical protein [Desulfobacteraceae bacterium]